MKKVSLTASSDSFVVPSTVPPTFKKQVHAGRSPGDNSEFIRPLKRRKYVEEISEPVYPFFGEKLHFAPKSIALRCLEFLNGKDIYNTSLVNHLWCKAAMDNALWETDE